MCALCSCVSVFVFSCLLRTCFVSSACVCFVFVVFSVFAFLYLLVVNPRGYQRSPLCSSTVLVIEFACSSSENRSNVLRVVIELLCLLASKFFTF